MRRTIPERSEGMQVNKVKLKRAAGDVNRKDNLLADLASESCKKWKSLRNVEATLTSRGLRLETCRLSFPHNRTPPRF